MDDLTEYNVTMGGDITALFAALAKAQGQMGAAKKGAANPHFRSKFADLASVLEAILPPLNSNGLALVQMPGFAEGKVTLTTLITHSGGGWMSSKASCKADKDNVQGVGSAITYLRRYCAQAALALPAVDDDGEAAMNRGAPPPPPPKKKEKRGGFQKAAPALPAKPDHHPSWKADYKAFLATAKTQVTVKPNQDLMQAIVEAAAGMGYTKRPSEMTSQERGDLLSDLRGEVF